MVGRGHCVGFVRSKALAIDAGEGGSRIDSGCEGARIEVLHNTDYSSSKSVNLAVSSPELAYFDGPIPMWHGLY